MHELETLSALAGIAEVWLNDLSSFDEPVDLVVAFDALEAGFLHFWNDIVASDHNTLDGDELFNMRWVHLSDLELFSQVVGSNLNESFTELWLFILHV